MSLPPSNVPPVATPKNQTLTRASKPASIQNRTLLWWQEAARYRFFVPSLLLILALTFYLPRITVPDHYLFDEILQAYSAGKYVEGNEDAYRWDHPCSVGTDEQQCAEAYPEARQDDRIGLFH